MIDIQFDRINVCNVNRYSSILLYLISICWGSPPRNIEQKLKNRTGKIQATNKIIAASICLNNQDAEQAWWFSCLPLLEHGHPSTICTDNLLGHVHINSKWQTHQHHVFPVTLPLRAQIVLQSLPKVLYTTKELPHQLLVLLDFFLWFWAGGVCWLASLARQKNEDSRAVSGFQFLNWTITTMERMNYWESCHGR